MLLISTIEDEKLLQEYGPPVIPEYKTAYSAGMDLSYWGPTRTLGPKGESDIFRTGLKFTNHYYNSEIQIRPRSGLAAKNGITVLNSPGTIDSDYEGEIMVILVNHSRVRFTIKNGDRIAQAVICPIIREPSYMSASIRGTGGFGSTGISS